MTTAGAPPRGDDDMPDPPATQPGAVHDGENSFAPPLTALYGNGLPGGYADTLDQPHQVPLWPGPEPPTAKARRRRRIRETLPEVGIVTLVLVILGGLLASAVLTSATVAVYDHARRHGAVITKTAGRPAPRPGAGVTPSAPDLPLGRYLAPRTLPAAPSPSRMPVPASSLPGTPGTSPAASTVRPRSSPAAQPTTVTVTTTPPGSPPPPSASAAPPPASTPAPTTPPPAPTPTTTAAPSRALTEA